jgi:hypothetical protein
VKCTTLRTLPLLHRFIKYIPNLRSQIREQQETLHDYIKGLHEWETEIKKKDDVLREKAKSGAKPDRNVSLIFCFIYAINKSPFFYFYKLPPIRGTVPQDEAPKEAATQDNLTLANTEKDKVSIIYVYDFI